MENRQSHQRTRLNPQIPKSLQEMLHICNPYVQYFKSALEIVGEDDEKKIVLVGSKKKTNDGKPRLLQSSLWV